MTQPISSNIKDESYWRIRKSSSWLRGGYKIELIGKGNETIYSERCINVSQQIKNMLLNTNQSVKLDQFDIDSTVNKSHKSFHVVFNAPIRDRAPSNNDASGANDIELANSSPRRLTQGKTTSDVSQTQQNQQMQIQHATVDINVDLQKLKQFYDQTKDFEPLPQYESSIPHDIRYIEAILSLKEGQVFAYKEYRSLLMYAKTKEGVLQRHVLNQDETVFLFEEYHRQQSHERVCVYNTKSEYVAVFHSIQRAWSEGGRIPYELNVTFIPKTQIDNVYSQLKKPQYCIYNHQRHGFEIREYDDSKDHVKAKVIPKNVWQSISSNGYTSYDQITSANSTT